MPTIAHIRITVASMLYTKRLIGKKAIRQSDRNGELERVPQAPTVTTVISAKLSNGPIVTKITEQEHLSRLPTVHHRTPKTRATYGK